MTSLPMPNSDPGFNINTAFNTMNQRLGELVRSGKMSIDQARAAQAEMRALQLNPAAANRQAATDIAQRHLQVGQYSPANVAAQQAAQQPQGGLTLAKTAQGVGGAAPAASPYDAAAAYRQNAMGLANAVQSGQMTADRARQLQAPLFDAVKMGSTPQGQAAMNLAATQAQGGMPIAGYDPAAQYRGFSQELAGMIRQGAITPAQANAIKSSVFDATKLGNSNQGYNQMQASLAAARQQMAQYPMPITPRTNPMAAPHAAQPTPQGLTMGNVPQQGVAPQPMSAPQGMAMGGLMEKYYGGGMC